MEFYKVIETRRSIRSYKPDPVPEESLNRIIGAVRASPSGSNRQPWRFIFINDHDMKTKIAINCKNQIWIGEAPIVVVACGPEISINRGGWMGDKSGMMDVSIAFTHFILSARAEGLGTCWIGAFDNEVIKKTVELPEDHNVVAISPLGYPKKDGFKETTRRKEISEIISWNEFKEGGSS
jgi:nitroreductase